MEKSKSPVTHFLHRNDRLRTIVRHKGVFCSEKQVNKRRVFTPHEPQTAGDEILELHRLYQNLVASDPESKQFKRRFTWVDSVPTTIPRAPTNVAVVEYIGTFPARLQGITTLLPPLPVGAIAFMRLKNSSAFFGLS